jgi:predicted MFS family arabinose efflux permease
MSRSSRTSTSNFTVLRHRNVSLALAAQFLASTAVSMQIVAIGYLLYETTGSKADLGLLGLAEFIPVIALVFVTGPFADRRDRRTIAAVCVALEVLIALGLAWWIHDHDSARTPYLVAAVLYGAARAFVSPATRSLLPAVTPEDEVDKALPLGSLSWQAAGILGPVLGGLLASALGSGVFLVVAALFAVAAFLYVLIPSQPPAAKPETGEMHLSDAFEGLRLIRRQPVLFGAIALDLFAVLFGGAVALLPAVAKDLLNTDGTGLGFLRMAVGAGGVAMGIVLAFKPITRNIGKVLLIAVGFFGVFTIGFGFSRNYALSWICLFGLSAADMVSVFIRTTLVPMATPDSLRGRVHAVESVFIGASNELGAAESGFAAALFGTAAAIIGGGVATLGIVALWFVYFKPLARVDRFEEVKPDYEGTPSLLP